MATHSNAYHLWTGVSKGLKVRAQQLERCLDCIIQHKTAPAPALLLRCNSMVVHRNELLTAMCVKELIETHRN